MKFILGTVALLAGLGVVQNNPTRFKKSSSIGQFSAINYVQDDLQAFTNQQLDKSFDFLVLSAKLGRATRPGFQKLYRKISDQAWKDTAKLIKYQSKRGLSVQINAPKDKVLNTMNNGKYKNQPVFDFREESLELAVDYDQFLAEESHRIHRKISQAQDSEGSRYDPDVAHFLDEQFIQPQSDTIRKLAGYFYKLRRITEDIPPLKRLVIHSFDDYLNKVE